MSDILNEKGWHPRPATAEDVPEGKPWQGYVVYERYDGLKTPAMPHAEAARKAALKLEEGGAESDAPAVPELPEDLKAAGWQIFRDRGEDGTSGEWLFYCAKGRKGYGQKRTNRWTDAETVIKGARRIQATEDKHAQPHRPQVEPEVAEVPAVTDDQRRAILARLEEQQKARWPRLRALEEMQSSASPLKFDEERELRELGRAVEAAYERAVEALGGDADAVQEVRDQVETVELPAAAPDSFQNVLESSGLVEGEEEPAALVPTAPTSPPLPGDFSTGASAGLVPQMHPSRISTHPSTLMRAGGLDRAHVEDLRLVIKAGGQLPPVDVYFDGQDYWLGDGNHRHKAAELEDALLDVIVHKGTLRDATLHAVRANASHGLKRTNDDKRLAVVTLLSDGEWSRQSDSTVAEMADVTQPFVGKVQSWLERVVTLAEEDADGEMGDEDYAEKAGIPVGFVSVVRGLDPGARASLFKNVTARSERRVGRDGRRLAVEKAGEADPPPLFNEPAAEEAAQAEEPAPHDEPAHATAAETEPAAETESEAAPAHAADDAADAPAEIVVKDSRRFADHMPAAAREEVPPPPAKGADAAPQQAASAPPREDKKPERPPVEELLGGLPLVITFSWNKFLPGKVTVAVRASAEIGDNLYDTLDSSKVRGLPESVIEMIGEAVKAAKKKPAAAAKAPAAAAAKATTKAAAKKSAAKATKKSPAARATKSPAKKAGPQKKGGAPARRKH